jgi:hypothetical protein
MDSLRIASRDLVPPSAGCCRCHEANPRWDRIAGQAFCPNCQEMLAQGEAEPLVLKTQKNRCIVCNHTGTVCYLTYPLQASAPVEMELCPAHLRSLLGRCLNPAAFQQLRRRLRAVGFDSDRVFLLHDAFYDPDGRACLPVTELE